MGLDKDHKEMKEGALPATRPVVSGRAGMSLSMSNILSDIIEALADARKDPPEVISTEDFKSRPPPQKISSIKAWIQPAARVSRGVRVSEEGAALLHPVHGGPLQLHCAAALLTHQYPESMGVGNKTKYFRLRLSYEIS